jgi:hypothetical protein
MHNLKPWKKVAPKCVVFYSKVPKVNNQTLGSCCGSTEKWWKWENKLNQEDPGLLPTPGNLLKNLTLGENVAESGHPAHHAPNSIKNDTNNFVLEIRKIIFCLASKLFWNESFEKVWRFTKKIGRFWEKQNVTSNVVNRCLLRSFQEGL